jgi:predicted transcriptional regulator of viral defense system
MADALATVEAPVVSSYAVARRFFLLLSNGEVEQAKQRFKALQDTLQTVRLLTPLDASSARDAYVIFGRSKATPAEIVCGLDPFAYVSHLSAMEHHGLTDRFPKILYMTRPSAIEWRKQATQRMAKDLGNRLEAFLASGLPRLVRPRTARVGHTTVQFCERSQLGAFRLVPGSSLRVATIGRVFHDMLREPMLCGGVQHVVDIYRRQAKRYLRLILDEVNQHGQPIDKVRAGYLLSEVCHLDAPELVNWQKLAQRGGSRKLDPEGEYIPIFSERWQLSINVPSLTVPGEDDG